MNDLPDPYVLLKIYVKSGEVIEGFCTGTSFWENNEEGL